MDNKKQGSNQNTGERPEEGTSRGRASEGPMASSPTRHQFRYEADRLAAAAEVVMTTGVVPRDDPGGRGPDQANPLG
jgi:hypothetical protein